MNKFNIPSEWLLKPLKVIVVGAGGTGSILLSLLSQIDLNLRSLSDNQSYLDLTVIDGDTVSPFNIGRQVFHSADISQFKSEVMVKRLNQFTSTQWSYSTDFLNPKDLEKIQFDLIITCVDSASFRHQLGAHFEHISTDAMWLDLGNDKDSAQIIFGNLGSKSKNRLPNIYDLYGDALASIVDRPEDSCSFQSALNSQNFGINHTVAIHASNLLWLLLRQGSINHHGAFISLVDNVVTPLAIDENVWQSFNYQPKATH